MVTSAPARSWLTSFELEQEGEGMPTIYEAELMGLRLRVTRDFILLRSSCCGEPLQAWNEEVEEFWACGGCDEDSRLLTTLEDRSPSEAMSPAVLEAWTELELDPLAAAVERAQAYDELAEAYGRVFGYELGKPRPGAPAPGPRDFLGPLR